MDRFGRPVLRQPPPVCRRRAAAQRGGPDGGVLQPWPRDACSPERPEPRAAGAPAAARTRIDPARRGGRAHGRRAGPEPDRACTWACGRASATCSGGSVTRGLEDGLAGAGDAHAVHDPRRLPAESTGHTRSASGRRGVPRSCGSSRPARRAAIESAQEAQRTPSARRSPPDPARSASWAALRADSSATSGCGWTSCGSRPRARGSAAGRTGSRSPRHGSARASPSEDDGLAHLVRAYLRAFGPGPVAGRRLVGGGSP